MRFHPLLPLLLILSCWGEDNGPGGAPSAAGTSPVIELPAAISQAVAKYDEAETKAKVEYQAAEAKAKAALLKSLEAEEARATKGGKLDLALAVRALRAKHDPSIGEVTGAPRTSLGEQELFKRMQGRWSVQYGDLNHIWEIQGRTITLRKFIHPDKVTDINRTYELSYDGGILKFIYETPSRSPTLYQARIAFDGETMRMTLASHPEGIQTHDGILTRMEQSAGVPSPSKPSR